MAQKARVLFWTYLTAHSSPLLHFPSSNAADLVIPCRAVTWLLIAPRSRDVSRHIWLSTRTHHVRCVTRVHSSTVRGRHAQAVAQCTILCVRIMDSTTLMTVMDMHKVVTCFGWSANSCTRMYAVRGCVTTQHIQPSKNAISIFATYVSVP